MTQHSRLSVAAFLLLGVLALGACKKEDALKEAEKNLDISEAIIRLQPPVKDPVITAQPLPPGMMVAGQPIDPLCFQAKMANQADNMLQNVNLNACRGDEIVLGEGESLTPNDKGFISYRYGYRDDATAPADVRIDSIAGYYYLGQLDGQMVVLTVLNGGGSGTFTNLATFIRSGDIMTMVKSYAGGDRCNNSVVGARIINNVLAYGINMTPADILDAAGVKSGYQLNLYSDVDSSAASCFGVAEYENGTLMTIALDSRAAIPAPTSSSKYQPCYNSLHRDYIKSGLQLLTRRHFLRFATDFRSRCLN